MRTIYTLLALLITTTGFAQSKVFLSFQGGGAFSHMEYDSKSAFHGSLGVEFKPMQLFSAELAFHTGNLAGQEGSFPNQFEFNNRFNLIALRGNLFLHELIDKGHNSGVEVFASAGVGYLMSNVKESVTPPNAPASSLYEGGDIVFPLGGGLDFEVTERTRFCLSILYHLALTDDLNGYAPDVTGNDANDSFTLLNVGFKFGL